MDTISRNVLYNEDEAHRRFKELVELGYNVAFEQVNLLAWSITYWTVL